MNGKQNPLSDANFGPAAGNSFPDPGLPLGLWLNTNSSLLFQLNEVLSATSRQIVKEHTSVSLSSAFHFWDTMNGVCSSGNRKMLYPEFPGPGKAFCTKVLYLPSRLWLGMLLTYRICSTFVFKWFSLRSTGICLFLRHWAFSHCLLIQSDSSVDSARFCSCTSCL